MRRLLGWTGMFALGSLGWWAGTPFGLVAAFLISLVGSGLGLYLGRRISRDYL